MERIISCNAIKKSFATKGKTLEVLKGIDLEIKQGEFVVIAGQNGCGKSTLLKIMIGLLIPDSGQITVLNKNMINDWKKVTKQIGVVLPSERCLYWKLNGRENLEIFGGIYGVPKPLLRTRIPELLAMVGLQEHQNTLVENYSTGMRRKLMLCKALLHQPQIIFADEVLNGLDPQAAKDIIEMLCSLNEQNITVVMVSHILHDLPQNSRLVILKEGQIIVDDILANFDLQTKLKIKATTPTGTVIETVNPENLSEVILALSRQGATDIRIETNDIYDLTRGYIA